jgi:hypothetical protein
VALGTVAGVLAISVIASVVHARRTPARELDQPAYPPDGPRG